MIAVSAVAAADAATSRTELPHRGSVELCSLDEVRLAGDGCLARAVRADVEYVRALDVDRLLAPFRREAGIRSSAHPYGHWESMGLDGHTLGHWLSAVSHLVASGNDADGELSRRLEYAVGELAKCQEKTGGRLDGIPGGGVVWDAVSRGDVGKVWERWAPWYNVHKTFAGLRDAWLEAGNVQAKATMTRLADWIVSTTANLDGAAMEKMLAQEFGGINETFADLYAITGDEKYLAEAKRWEHHAVLDPLYRKEDALTGLHANTQIPKFAGLARTGELADDRARLEAADFAWRTIVERRSVAFGGNSVGEHFHALDDFGKMLGSREGPETCNTYNMLRLTERLFECDPRAEYAEYYERALFNHVLSAVNTLHPGFVYFTPARAGHYRTYSTPQTTFWCCVGTGMECPGRFGRFIYARGNGAIYINLFVPSELKGVLRQTTGFPYSGETTIDMLAPFDGDLMVREGASYVRHKGPWKRGDRVRASRPMDRHVEMLPDGSGWGAYMDGPILLAQDRGAENMDGMFSDGSASSQTAAGPLLEPLDEPSSLVPFWTLHERRYQIYWKFGSGKGIAADTVPAAAASGACVERVPLEEGWRFRLDGETAWRDVRVPHDWSIGHAPDKDAPSGFDGGFYPCGRGVYELSLVLSREDVGKRQALEFDGVYRKARVSVNGREAACGPDNGYIPFSVSLDSLAAEGTNTVVVEVDNSAQPNSRWYSGSGIFRNVFLEKRTGPDVRNIHVAARADGHVTIRGEVDGREVVESVRVDNPVPWTPENPRLYEFNFHGVKVRTGIRTIGLNAREGMTLNGKPVKMHGACVHHDNGPLGACAFEDAERRKVRLLKSAGFNAVRTSHNPPSEAFLDACDEEGLMVVEELFDVWHWAKLKHDFAESFEREWEDDMRRVIMRDRNHPCVVFWSLGNELNERATDWAAAQCARMASVCRELAPGIPVTAGMAVIDENDLRAQYRFAESLDAIGVNYYERGIDAEHAANPDRLVIVTESYPASAVANEKLISARPYVLGEFVWTGIDYLGESGIGRMYREGIDHAGECFESPQFPVHGTMCGEIDITGRRKAVSHLRDVLWNESAKSFVCVREPEGWRANWRATKWSTGRLRESWTYPGWEGREIQVEVYTRGARVTLSVNGREAASSDVSAESGRTAVFRLPYEPGVLEAQVYGADGTRVESLSLRTAGTPQRIRFTDETVGRLTWRTAEVVDAEGTVCMDADREVDFGADAICTASADMSDIVPAASRVRRTFEGRAIAVLCNDSKAQKENK